MLKAAAIGQPESKFCPRTEPNFYSYDRPMTDWYQCESWLLCGQSFHYLPFYSGWFHNANELKLCSFVVMIDAFDVVLVCEADRPESVGCHRFNDRSHHHLLITRCELVRLAVLAQYPAAPETHSPRPSALGLVSLSSQGGSI